MSNLSDLGLCNVQCNKCGIDLRLNTTSLETIRTHNPYCFDVNITCRSCGHINKKKFKLEELSL